MRDKRAALVDRGWENMKGVLDVEVLVGKKRRVLWLPLLIILIGIATIALAIYRGNTSVKNNSREASDMLIASDKSNDDKAQTSKTTSETIDQDIASIEKDAILTDKGASNPSSIFSEKELPADPFEEGQSTLLGTDLTLPSLRYPQPDNSKQPGLRSFNITPGNDRSNADLFENDNLTEHVFSSFFIVDKSPIKRFELDALKFPLRFSVVDLKVVDLKDEKRANGHFYFVGHLGHLVNSEVFLAGPTIKYNHPISNSFFVRSGLSYYKAFNFNNSTTNFQTEPPESFDPLDPSAPGQEIDVSVSEPSIPVVPINTTLSTIEFALALGYKFDSHWSAYAGACLANNYGEFPVISQSTQTRAVAEPQAEKFNDTRFGLMTGINYGLGSRFGLNFEYTYSLRDYIPSEQHSRVNQRVVLGLNYRF